MKTKYIFFYDESGHSRRLTKDTLSASNYDDHFVGCIVGINESKREKLEKEYLALEKPYKTFFQVKELKSQILSRDKYKFGFASFKKDDLNLISDYLDFLINNKCLVYISVFNKIEYLVSQLLDKYKNSLFIDADALRYSIVKAINIYRPKNVLDAMYQGAIFKKELCAFLKETIENNGNKKHKEYENIAFSQALYLLRSSDDIKTIDWDYKMSFQGFVNYLEETSIVTDSVVVDEEGSKKTLEAAIQCGFQNSREAKSDFEFGIRLADMLAGIINGFLISLVESLRYKNDEEKNGKLLLSKKWFEINERQWICYKKLRTVIVTIQKEIWYKTYCSYYSDAFSSFVCLLNYISDKGLDFLVKNKQMNPEYLNTMTCLFLKERYELLRSKLPIKFAKDEGGYFLNSRGAKEYFDNSKRIKMELKEGEKKKYKVLSVGIMHNTNTPTMTIQTDNGPTAIDLPIEYREWAFNLVAYANMGENLLPATIVFTKFDGKYYADIE